MELKFTSGYYSILDNLRLFLSDQQEDPFAKLPKDGESYYQQYVLFALHALHLECQFEYKLALKLRTELAKTVFAGFLNFLASVELALRLGIYTSSCFNCLKQMDLGKEIDQKQTRFITIRLLNILASLKYSHGLESIPEDLQSFCLEFFESQVLLDLENPMPVCNLAYFYYLLEKNEESLELYTDLKVSHRNNAEVLYGIASVLIQQGNTPKAITYLDDALRWNPHLAKAWLKYGIIISQVDPSKDKLSHFHRAASLLANYAQHKLQYAHIFSSFNQSTYAAHNYYQVIKHIPTYQYIWYNIGMYWFEHGDPQVALQYAEKSLNVDPGDVSTYELHARALVDLCKRLEALDYLLKAIKIYPGSWNINLQAVQILLGLQRPEEALEILESFLRIGDPKLSLMIKALMAHTHLHCGYGGEGTVEVSIKFLESEILNEKSSSSLNSYNWYFLYTRLLFIIPNIRDDISLNAIIFFLLGEKATKEYYYPNLKPFKESSAISNSHSNRKNEPAELAVNSTCFHGRQLKVGFLSPHFYNHPVAFLSHDVLHQLSNQNIALHVIASSYVCRASSFLNRISANEKITTIELYKPVTEQISELEKLDLDILVDLDGVTGGDTISVLCYKPARICMSWLGFDAPYLSKDNYFLCDRYTHPEGVDSYYLEKLVRLPHSHMCVGEFDLALADRDAVRSSLGITPDQIVFFYSAAARKFNRQTASAHAQILKNVPNSVLLRKSLPGKDVPQIIYGEECLRFNVEPGRVVPLPRSSTEAEHRALYLAADMCLDAYPYNGGSQNLEALWFNLPVVTYKGMQSFSRMGYSLLTTLQIDYGIAHSWEEYIDFGVQLALNRDLRFHIREKLIQSKQTDSLSPLWNPKLFAENMYNIFVSLL